MKILQTVALLLAALGSASPARPDERPMNVIFLLADDQRWDTLGSYGNRIIETPELDQLAREGVRFEHMFVTTSICMTSRASFITGQYARRHRIWDFETELSPTQLAESYLGRMKAAGYHLGFIGKWGVGDPPKDYFDCDRTFPGQGRFFLEVDGETRHLTSVMGDQAIEFVSTAPADRPFCLSVSFKAAHVQDSYDITDTPFPYDPALADLYQDVEIEPRVSALPQFFERLPRPLQDSEARLRWAIRFWGPSRHQESVRGYYRLVTGIDRVVGRLRAALEPSASMRGRSVMPLVRGESPEWRRDFFYEHLFEHPRIPKTEGVRTDRWKYIRYVDEDPAIEELYDLSRDPQELENLAGRAEWRPVLDRLRQAWSEWGKRAR